MQQRYAALQRSALLAPLLGWQGFEERLLADPSFMVKVGIEVRTCGAAECATIYAKHDWLSSALQGGSRRSAALWSSLILTAPPPSCAFQVGIGICTKTTAEATKRGGMFFAELDFVIANVIMALVADFCLVWLPAPRVSWR